MAEPRSLRHEMERRVGDLVAHRRSADAYPPFTWDKAWRALAPIAGALTLAAGIILHRMPGRMNGWAGFHDPRLRTNQWQPPQVMQITNTLTLDLGAVHMTGGLNRSAIELRS